MYLIWVFGLIAETKVRPQLTSIIAASSGAMKADEVAKKALSGIKSGSFIIPCNFEGLLLSIATAGFAPQRSFVMAFVEIVAAGIIRFAALCFQWNWYGSIEKWHTQKNSKYCTKYSIEHQED
jgi:3-dehydrosphinganine reductase